MAALPYMQLYVADYLADTMHLTTEEHGAYLLLIFNYWQTGKPIPVSRLARIARLSNERWTDVERSLNEFFNERSGEWVHDRIERDLDLVHATQNQRIAAGKASAEARRKVSKARTAKAGNARSTSVEFPLNENPTNRDTDTDTDTDKPIDGIAREGRFPMPLNGWDVEQKSFKAVAFKNSVPVSALTAETLAAFTSYWHARPEKEQSQAQWEFQLVQHLNNLIQRAKASGSSANGNARPENHSPVGNPPPRKGSRSAVDQVRDAIADRDAREAAEASARQAVDENDGDVRAPLDGEFRRIG